MTTDRLGFRSDAPQRHPHYQAIADRLGGPARRFSLEDLSSQTKRSERQRCPPFRLRLSR
jgi:hypothetical protein